MKQAAALLVLAAAGAAQSATVLSEGFDNVAGLTSAGWALVNNSSLVAGPTWFQGNPAVFTSASGAPNAYAAANFASTANPVGAVSNWLILPVLTLDSTSTVTFKARTAGDQFLDTLEVRFSAGTGTDVGTTSTSVGTFTSLLGSFAADSATGWITLSYSLGLSTPTTGRLAFRYVVDNVQTAGNYLGIDSVAVTAVPEPAAYLLMGLGVTALLIRRRMAA